MDNYRLLLDYAKSNYHRMFREPEGRLKHRFIVPGSCYSNCLWDWDSWLTNIALRHFARCGDAGIFGRKGYWRSIWAHRCMEKLLSANKKGTQ